ncbi:hypothetical protein [Kurthia sibirica]|uniref:Uncharacterized protein n=1 Tax=Kurthia sibirica TaxID=202750 RepID=A0A2U3AP18_9BACL|nr:hypothetical protein [Kurthia sibirica]PWI26277.1 hypothetical protein DEX24_04950 [Kurthia sibirica]GEK33892.1 hypothetical protein KSI01_14250 [Kurthia sibirica]
MEKEYQILEQHIIEKFKKEGKFNHKGEVFEVEHVGKTRTMGAGEPKTAIYLQGVNGTKKVEVKIALTLRGENDFIGAALKPDTAEALFGTNWKEIIKAATDAVQEKMKAEKLIYTEKVHKTPSNSILLGWEVEVTDKNRPIRTDFPLTEQEVRDVIYKGINLPENLKNAHVHGTEIANSGIANYALETTKAELKTVADIMGKLEDIDTMELPKAHITFKPNFYRTKLKKYDGKKYLAAAIKWSFEDETFTPEFDFDDIFQINHGQYLTDLLAILKSLPTHNPLEMDPALLVKTVGK